MHPFLPTLSIVFLLVADGVLGFILLYGRDPAFQPHTQSMYAIVIVALISGGGLAWWLRRFGIRFPSWLAVVTLLLFGLLRFA